MDPHHYLQAVEAYIVNDLERLNAFVAGTTGSQSEKKLIRARILARDGKYSEAEALLTSFTPETPLLRGERHFVLANILSHSSRWQVCAVEAHQAVYAYQACGHRRGLFLAHYNLSVYYNRLGLDELSFFHLSCAEPFAMTPAHASLIHRARACHYAQLQDTTKSLCALEEALALQGSLDQVDLAALHSVAADLYFRAGFPEIALRFIESLARSRVVRDKARVRFDLILLRGLVGGGPHLLTPEVPETIRLNEEYLLRWNIIDALQSGDLSRARNHWEKLCILFPQRFGAEFTCLKPSDEKIIFITAVRRLMSKQEKNVRRELSGRLGRLYDIMSSCVVPLRKEELIELVWGISYDPAYDGRFYKLLERLRKVSGVEVQVVNYTYRLVS